MGLAKIQKNPKKNKVVEVIASGPIIKMTAGQRILALFL